MKPSNFDHDKYLILGDTFNYYSSSESESEQKELPVSTEPESLADVPGIAAQNNSVVIERLPETMESKPAINPVQDPLVGSSKDNRGPGLHKCRQCPVMFSKTSSRAKHEILEHSTERVRENNITDNQYKCEYCIKTFKDRHLKWHHKVKEHSEQYQRDKILLKNDNGLYKCRLCPKELLSPGARATHELRKHLNKMETKTEIERKRSLLANKRSHKTPTSMESGQVLGNGRCKCRFCPKELINPSGRGSHELHKHSNEIKTKTETNKKANQKSTFNEEVIYKHGTLKRPLKVHLDDDIPCSSFDDTKIVDTDTDATDTDDIYSELHIPIREATDSSDKCGEKLRGLQNLERHMKFSCPFGITDKRVIDFPSATALRKIADPKNEEAQASCNDIRSEIHVSIKQTTESFGPKPADSQVSLRIPTTTTEKDTLAQMTEMNKALYAAKIKSMESKPNLLHEKNTDQIHIREAQEGHDETVHFPIGEEFEILSTSSEEDDKDKSVVAWLNMGAKRSRKRKISQTKEPVPANQMMGAQRNIPVFQESNIESTKKAELSWFESYTAGINEENTYAESSLVKDEPRKRKHAEDSLHKKNNIIELIELDDSEPIICQENKSEKGNEVFMALTKKSVYGQHDSSVEAWLNGNRPPSKKRKKIIKIVTAEASKSISIAQQRNKEGEPVINKDILEVEKPKNTAVKTEDDDEIQILEVVTAERKNDLVASSPSCSSGFISGGSDPLTTNSGLAPSLSSNDFSSARMDIEKSPMPLSAAIYTKATQNPKEMMVVWCETLEEDLLSAACMNPSNTLLCIEDLETFRQSDSVQEVLKRSALINFSVLKLDDSSSQWTLITFCEQGPPKGLANKLLTGFDKMENILKEYATSKQMSLTNMMRYSKEGLFNYLPHRLSGKVTAYNYHN